MNRTFECTVYDPNQYVGLEIIRDRANKTIFIYQSYVSRILKLFNIENSTSAKAPAEPNYFLQKQENNPAGEVPYRQAVSMLKFLAIVSRPDIMFLVAQVSRFLDSPFKEHWTAVKKIFKYLKGMSDCGICYSGANLEPQTYSNADYATDVDTRKSISEYTAIMAGGAVSWSWKQQKCVSRSRAKAEYVSASDAAQEAQWLRTFLKELEVFEGLLLSLWITGQPYK
ncbi:hypothetical protein ILUMI_21142 [Ignelater luminosus]|uniref:Uncharacterized protein n=1 Tax=Ignelater luminosus TaxID=2038154 RepID=A0A8K0CH14_IGNLU|nr:hypothetical protein ILUMI_21142 [Ignelater luminosus]